MLYRTTPHDSDPYHWILGYVRMQVKGRDMTYDVRSMVSILDDLMIERRHKVARFAAKKVLNKVVH